MVASDETAETVGAIDKRRMIARRFGTRAVALRESVKAQTLIEL